MSRNTWPRVKGISIDWLDGIIDAQEDRPPRVSSDDVEERLEWDIRDRFYWLGYQGVKRLPIGFGGSDTQEIHDALALRKKERP